MDWTLTLAAFIIGLVLGYVLHSLISRNSGEKVNAKVIEQAQMEMSQYRQEVTDQYAGHLQQLSQLTEQLNRVNQSWNDTANTLQLDGKLPPLAQLQRSNATPNNADNSGDKIEK
ncbi:hypothetical protein NFHSH190041_32790 [Shewanella sp. NFH-SH190041]|uniref:YhcB family protein n=1 Tax=Shewanella sp. NFH-SH190041 TaxID=2950245 RepID=UPI0021C3EA19|nr:YhcB family protein [Shewanella sp. NFH-SH190041]BDM65827.1 hypothetical protein NFHSH190041_32790 [Shewanella sp. NFH-SH190041]